MKALDFDLSIDELYGRLKSLTATKGEEYKRREDNQFANFERGAQSLGLTREQVLMVYLSKHLDSITTYVKDRAVGRDKTYAEPISGRIDDAILYLLLLRGMTVDNDQHVEKCDSRVGQGRIQGLVRAEFKEQWPLVKTFVVSPKHTDAVQLCHTMGIEPGVYALGATDQLHGVAPGAHVIFIHHGTRNDEAMLVETVARCDKQGLTYEVHHL